MKKSDGPMTYQVDLWMPVSPPWFAELELCDMGTSMTYAVLSPGDVQRLLYAVRSIDSDAMVTVTEMKPRKGRHRHIYGNVSECILRVNEAHDALKREERAKARR